MPPIPETIGINVAKATTWDIVPSKIPTTEDARNAVRRFIDSHMDLLFTDEIILSYKTSTLEFWAKELKGRIVESNRDKIRDFVRLHDHQSISDLDIVNWTRIENIKWELMKDTVETKSLFSQIDLAIDEEKYEEASDLQKIMSQKVGELTDLYTKYKKNIF